MSRCQCSGCGARFNGERAFDAHRVGAFASSGRGGRTSSRRCLTEPAELVAAGLTLRHSKATASPGTLAHGLMLWGLALPAEREAVASATGAAIWGSFGPSVAVPEKSPETAADLLAPAS